jgi:hypothetical protein
LCGIRGRITTKARRHKSKKTNHNIQTNSNTKKEKSENDAPIWDISVPGNLCLFGGYVLIEVDR